MKKKKKESKEVDGIQRKNIEKSLGAFVKLIKLRTVGLQWSFSHLEHSSIPRVINLKFEFFKAKKKMANL